MIDKIYTSTKFTHKQNLHITRICVSTKHGACKAMQHGTATDKAMCQLGVNDWKRNKQ